MRRALGLTGIVAAVLLATASVAAPAGVSGDVEPPETRIVGGWDSSTTLHPWMVALTSTTGGFSFCGRLPAQTRSSPPRTVWPGSSPARYGWCRAN